MDGWMEGGMEGCAVDEEDYREQQRGGLFFVISR
jgi:hypothetical protein